MFAIKIPPMMLEFSIEILTNTLDMNLMTDMSAKEVLLASSKLTGSGVIAGRIIFGFHSHVLISLKLVLALSRIALIVTSPHPCTLSQNNRQKVAECTTLDLSLIASAVLHLVQAAKQLTSSFAQLLLELLDTSPELMVLLACLLDDAAQHLNLRLQLSHGGLQ